MNSDTVKKQRLVNLRPFRKNTDAGGPDPRINRKGRPKGFDELRKLAQEIGAEEDGNATVIYNALRKLAKSRSGKEIKTFLEYAYGKVRDEVDVTSGGGQLKIVFEYENNDEKGSVT